MQAYSYSAFISYRHTLPDEEIAKKLHTYIENYSIPGQIRRATGKKKMGRVFRDQEELPLSNDLGNDIRTALDHSEWLIAICSPRYLESRWCMAELEYFISLGRKDHILVILVEGEPQDSFPQQLRYSLVDGVWKEVEPLAGDVRAATLSESLKKLKSEKLRVLAPMLGVNFDQLRQRARKRRRRIIAGAAAAGFAVMAGFLAYALVKNGQVTDQRDLAMDNQMQLLTGQASISVSDGDKETAVGTLREAIGLREIVGEGNDAALRSALEYALYSDIFGTAQTIKNDNRKFSEMIYSYNDKYILGINSYYAASLIDTSTGEILYTVSRSFSNEVDSAGFTKDDRYIYTVDSFRNVVSLYDVKTGKLFREYKEGSEENWMIADDIYALSDGRLLIPKEKSILLWDYEADKFEEILPAGSGAMDIYTRISIVDLSPDESMLAFGSPGYGYGMRIVRLSDLSEVSLEKLPGDGVTLSVGGKEESGSGQNTDRGYWNIRFSGDSQYVTAISGSLYFVWDASDGRMVLAGYLETEDSQINSAVLSDDGSMLFVMTNNYLGAIQVKTGKTKWSVSSDDTNTVTEAVISPNGRYLCAVGGINGIYDIRTGEKLSDRKVTAFSHDGKRLIADTYTNNPVVLFSPEASTAKRVSEYRGELYRVERYTDPPKSINIDLTHQAAEFYTTYPGNIDRYAMLYNSPDLCYSAYTHEDGFMEIFDISDPDNTKEIYCLADHCFNAVKDVTFNGDLMASCGGYDPRCVIFDLKEGRILHILAGEEYVQSCEFSEDGSKIILLCGYLRNIALVYATDTGNLLYRFDAPEGKMFKTIGFNVNGAEVAAIVEDGSAYVGELYPTLDDLIAAAAE